MVCWMSGSVRNLLFYCRLKDGTRILCTMIHCPDNHVISVTDPDSWYNSSILGKQKAFGWFGPRWRVSP